MGGRRVRGGIGEGGAGEHFKSNLSSAADRCVFQFLGRQNLNNYHPS